MHPNVCYVTCHIKLTMLNCAHLGWFLVLSIEIFENQTKFQFFVVFQNQNQFSIANLINYNFLGSATVVRHPLPPPLLMTLFTTITALECIFVQCVVDKGITDKNLWKNVCTVDF